MSRPTDRRTLRRCPIASSSEYRFRGSLGSDAHPIRGSLSELFAGKKQQPVLLEFDRVLARFKKRLHFPRDKVWVEGSLEATTQSISQKPVARPTPIFPMQRRARKG